MRSLRNLVNTIRDGVTKSLTLVSPVDGVVLDKPVNAGQRVVPGTLLYRLADLTEVWVVAMVLFAYYRRWVIRPERGRSTDCTR